MVLVLHQELISLIKIYFLLQYSSDIPKQILQYLVALQDKLQTVSQPAVSNMIPQSIKHSFP